MKQTTLSAGDFDHYNKATRRAAFLAERDRVVPWSALCALIEPAYPCRGQVILDTSIGCFATNYFS